MILKIWYFFRVAWGTSSTGAKNQVDVTKLKHKEVEGTIILDMSEILDYLGAVKFNHDEQVTIPYKWPTKGDGQGENKANDTKGKLYEAEEGEEKPKLKVSTETTVQQSVKTYTKQVSGSSPVLIYYSITTKDGSTADIKQATQKNYKEIIKQLEAKGAVIENVDIQTNK